MVFGFHHGKNVGVKHAELASDYQDDLDVSDDDVPIRVKAERVGKKKFDACLLGVRQMFFS